MNNTIQITQIIARVVATDRATLGDALELEELGIPVMRELDKFTECHTTDMLSRGEICATTFAAAIAKALGEPSE